jgi:TPR repeat protein
MNLFGMGIPINYENSKKYFEEIQEIIPMAKTMLGLNSTFLKRNKGYMHLEGLGFTKNEEKAKEIFEQSSESSVLSVTFLGQMYVEGKGVEKDLEKGIKMIELAASMNDANAISYLANYHATIKENRPKVESLLRKLREMGDSFATEHLQSLKNEDKVLERLNAFIDKEFKDVNTKIQLTDEQEDLTKQEKEAYLKNKKEEEIYNRIQKNKAQLFFGDESQQLIGAESFLKTLQSSTLQSKQGAMKGLKEMGFDIENEKIQKILKQYYP